MKKIFGYLDTLFDAFLKGAALGIGLWVVVAAFNGAYGTA